MAVNRDYTEWNELENFFCEVLEARDRLRGLKTEFAQVESKFNDFNFNNEMVEVMMNSPREDMAPFANLFNKHIGNLSERYKLTEAMYDRFLDKFIELKHQLKRPPIIRNESETIGNLLVKIAELLTREEKLQAELNETKAELSKNSTNAIKSHMMQQRKELESQGERLVEIDTDELAMKSLAKRTNLPQLVHSPDKWCMLPKKFQCYNFNECYTKSEHAAKQKASGQKHQKGNTFRMRFTNTDTSLDTVEVSKRLKDIIRMHRIDFCWFARWKLYVSSGKFAQLLSQSKEWASLSMTDKKAYLRMQKWSLATEEEIVALKKFLADRIRLYKNKQLAKEKTN